MTRYFDELNQTFVTIDYIQTDSRLLRRYRYDNAPHSFVIVPVIDQKSNSTQEKEIPRVAEFFKL